MNRAFSFLDLIIKLIPVKITANHCFCGLFYFPKNGKQFRNLLVTWNFLLRYNFFFLWNRTINILTTLIFEFKFHPVLGSVFLFYELLSIFRCLNLIHYQFCFHKNWSWWALYSWITWVSCLYSNCREIQDWTGKSVMLESLVIR